MKLGEAAKRLRLMANEVKTTTVAMESDGFTFERDERGFRDYSEDHLKEIVKRRGKEYPVKAKQVDEARMIAESLREENRPVGLLHTQEHDRMTMGGFSLFTSTFT